MPSSSHNISICNVSIRYSVLFLLQGKACLPAQAAAAAAAAAASVEIKRVAVRGAEALVWLVF